MSKLGLLDGIAGLADLAHELPETFVSIQLMLEVIGGNVFEIAKYDDGLPRVFQARGALSQLRRSIGYQRQRLADSFCDQCLFFGHIFLLPLHPRHNRQDSEILMPQRLTERWKSAGSNTQDHQNLLGTDLIGMV